MSESLEDSGAVCNYTDGSFCLNTVSCYIVSQRLILWFSYISSVYLYCSNVLVCLVGKVLAVFSWIFEP